MSKLLLFFILDCFFLAGCIPPLQHTDMYLGGGFVSRLKGADPLLHKPGQELLYRDDASGKRILIWSGLTNFPDRVNDIVVFNARLDARSDYFVMACGPEGLPVNITERVTQIYCSIKKIDYASEAGRHYYVLGLNRNSTETKDEPLFRLDAEDNFATLRIPPDTARQWIAEAQKGGLKKVKANCEYMDPILLTEPSSG